MTNFSNFIFGPTNGSETCWIHDMKHLGLHFLWNNFNFDWTIKLPSSNIFVLATHLVHITHTMSCRHTHIFYSFLSLWYWMSLFWSKFGTHCKHLYSATRIIFIWSCICKCNFVYFGHSSLTEITNTLKSSWTLGNIFVSLLLLC